MKYCVIMGNPILGFHVVGPFLSERAVAQFLERVNADAGKDEPWKVEAWIAPLWPPNNFRKAG